jgi:hypothetical protein
MKEFNEIHLAIESIRAEFTDDFARMDFLFTYRKGSHRTVVNIIRSLPNISLSVSDKDAPDVVFESNWPNERREPQQRPPEGGWQAAATRRRYQNSFFAHTCTAVRKVREIAIFDYGFEINAADNFEIVAVKWHTLRHPDVGELQSLVGRKFKGLQFIEDTDLELKGRWIHPILIERAKQKAEKQKQFINVGQVTRELLIDDDI